MDFISWIATDQALLPLLAGILSAAAIYPIGMLFGTGQGCCCGNPACCQHFCNKMCCNQVKWVVPGYTDFFTGVSVDCRAGLTVPATGLQIRVRVRCEGYVYEFPVGAQPWEIQYRDCDTDCQFVEVEYSEDGGTTWTTTPPESAAGITWSIHCDGDAEQPTADASAPRCAAITSLNAAQCEAADGEPCSLPCADCALPCGPEPTEWRLIDRYTGIVWFAGYVVPNPLYTGEGEAFCYDPCDNNSPSDPVSPQLLLEHFPFVSYYCDYTPAGWPTTEGTWLHLEVLGCDGAQWTPVAKWCGCHQDIGHYWIIGDWPNQIDPCFISDYFWRDVGEPLRGNGGVYSTGGILLQSPPGCACLRDPATGEMVGQTDTTYDRFCCPTCNRYLGATGCSTGLEYLDHGEAVRFTGEVDNEGSNLWNWEDANGDSPAGSWPSGAITIAGELRSWRGPTMAGTIRGNYHPDLASLSFPSVTLEPGAVLAISLTTETLTADAATIAELMLDGGGVPKACANGGQYEVRIVVTGAATFINGAENLAKGEDGTAEWLVFPDATAGITGDCVFESGSKNTGTIRGNCTFSDDASNDGKVAGDCTFADTAENSGSIWGNCTFSGDAVNNGTITGDATFSGNATNAGTVTGNCTFSGSATNTGTVDGDATFNGTASMAGNVTGTATFNDDACWSSGTAGTFDPDPPPAC